LDKFPGAWRKSAAHRIIGQFALPDGDQMLAADRTLPEDFQVLPMQGGTALAAAGAALLARRSVCYMRSSHIVSNNRYLKISPSEIENGVGTSLVFQPR